MSADNEKLMAKIEKIDGRLKDMRSEYLETIQELQEKTEAAIKKNADLRPGLEFGTITLQGFKACHLSSGEIRKHERTGFEKEIAAGRDQIRKLHEERTALSRTWYEAAFEVQRMINRTVSGLLELKLNAAEDLRQYAGSDMALSSLKSQVEKCNLEYPQAWTWEVKSVEDLESLALKSNIAEEHFPQLFERIDELREDGMAAPMKVEHCRRTMGEGQTGFRFSNVLPLSPGNAVTTNLDGQEL